MLKNSSRDYQIRNMQTFDMGRVEYIWYHESVRVHHWMDNPNQFWEDKREDFRSLIKNLDQTIMSATSYPQWRVYVENNIVKGFIIKREDNYIPELFVCHDDERSGIGTALIDDLKQLNNYLKVSVYEQNSIAVNFYKHNGFIKTSSYTEIETGQTKFHVEWVM